MDDCETGTCPPAMQQKETQTAPVPQDTAISSIHSATKGQVDEDPMNWKTFRPPVHTGAFANDNLSPSIVIEFCNRCRWQHRATWLQTELFLTFEDKPSDAASTTGKYATSTGLKSIMLIPCNAPETGGRFRVWLYRQRRVDEEGDVDKEKGSTCGDKPAMSTAAHGTHFIDDCAVSLLWDRKIRGGFPELKELKQIVRDHIAPSTSLGHSDKKGPQRAD